MHKVILIIIDGLAHEVARHSLGYLLAMTEAERATAYKLQCELPSLSRPLYETILTGTRPVDHGVVHNEVVRLSNETSVFHLARQAGLTTAAAAYHWVSELYNRAPYDALRDRFTSDKSLPIQHGAFYHLDHYPDSHLLLDAEWLRQSADPDLLLIHPMNVDDAGHKFGLDSSQYRNSARHFDLLLADYVPRWLEAGYQLLITSDHGMNRDRSHGGNLPEEREVPLFVLGSAFSHNPQAHPRQTELCGTVASLLGIAHDKPLCRELLR
ncbi:alkaline phosphatase family protein [Oceanimonas pelagia]|uniref:Alkaline phosphatase family protein n=1 Tax=Oceanimonas pelagia TaxID=3028314 RepID=A0AA50KPB4_9GAMM|nr:alkaline phosphatase family protein [Oceanimonas pelagia]WMC11218.1 alkaline phosphatase family protein [Oceanimonas pelagia]